MTREEILTNLEKELKCCNGEVPLCGAAFTCGEDCPFFVDNENLIDTLQTAYTIIKALPEQKKGEWMLGFDNKYMEKYYYCSCCGGRKYTEDKPLDYFCSKCGADMRLKEVGTNEHTD